MQYLVEWSIDIFDAESPEDAAREALEAITRQDSIAHVFEVTPHSGTRDETVSVDLDALNEEVNAR